MSSNAINSLDLDNLSVEQLKQQLKEKNSQLERLKKELGRKDKLIVQLKQDVTTPRDTIKAEVLLENQPQIYPSKNQFKIKSTDLILAREAFEITAQLIKSENRNKARSELKVLKKENYLTIPGREILIKQKELNEINDFQRGIKKGGHSHQQIQLSNSTPRSSGKNEESNPNTLRINKNKNSDFTLNITEQKKIVNIVISLPLHDRKYIYQFDTVTTLFTAKQEIFNDKLRQIRNQIDNFKFAIDENLLFDNENQSFADAHPTFRKLIQHDQTIELFLLDRRKFTDKKHIPSHSNAPSHSNSPQSQIHKNQIIANQNRGVSSLIFSNSANKMSFLCILYQNKEKSMNFLLNELRDMKRGLESGQIFFIYQIKPMQAGNPSIPLKSITHFIPLENDQLHFLDLLHCKQVKLNNKLPLLSIGEKSIIYSFPYVKSHQQHPVNRRISPQRSPNPQHPPQSSRGLAKRPNSGSRSSPYQQHGQYATFAAPRNNNQPPPSNNHLSPANKNLNKAKQQNQRGNISGMGNSSPNIRQNQYQPSPPNKHKPLVSSLDSSRVSKNNKFEKIIVDDDPVQHRPPGTFQSSSQTFSSPLHNHNRANHHPPSSNNTFQSSSVSYNKAKPLLKANTTNNLSVNTHHSTYNQQTSSTSLVTSPSQQREVLFSKKINKNDNNQQPATIPIVFIIDNKEELYFELHPKLTVDSVKRMIVQRVYGSTSSTSSLDSRSSTNSIGTQVNSNNIVTKHALKITGTSYFVTEGEITISELPIVRFSLKKGLITMLSLVSKENSKQEKLISKKISLILDSATQSQFNMEDNDASDFRIRMSRIIGDREFHYIPGLVAELFPPTDSPLPAQITIRIHYLSSASSSGAQSYSKTPIIDQCSVTLLVPSSSTIENIIQLACKKLESSMKSSQFIPSDYYLKISGQSNYISTGVIDALNYVRECDKKKKFIEFLLIKKSINKNIDLLFDEYFQQQKRNNHTNTTNNDQHVANSLYNTPFDNATIDRYGDDDTVSLLELKSFFEIKIISVENLFSIKKFSDENSFSITVAIYFGFFFLFFLNEIFFGFFY